MRGRHYNSVEYLISGLLKFVYGAETVSLFPPSSFPYLNVVVRIVLFATVSNWQCLLRDLSALTLSTLVQGPA